MNDHPNSPASTRPASAVLRTGDHAPALLLGAPIACPPAQPGAASVILGWTTSGEPVEVTASSRRWAADLVQAAADIYAQFAAETTLGVPA